ncbi:hypothetical protein ACHAXT_001836 [Thalassiosira profunda]
MDRVVAVTVPPGSLGIALGAIPPGSSVVRVQSLRANSAANGLLFPGDALLAVAGVPVRGLSAERIAAHFKARIAEEREVTVLRPAAVAKPPSAEAAQRVVEAKAAVARAAATNEPLPPPKPAKKKKAAAKKAAKPSKPPQEKRLGRYRSTPTNFVRDRIARAASQRMYLVHRGDVFSSTTNGPSCELAVLGSTGNLYKVTLGRVTSCNCPDARKHAMRHRGKSSGGSPLCKHILFVFLKVAGLSASDPLAFQAALLTEEVETVLEKIARRSGGGGAMANATVRNAFASEHGLAEVAVEEKKAADAKAEEGKEEDGGVKRKSPTEQTECLICFEDLSTESPEKFATSITFCRGACGSNFHDGCIQKWHASASELARMFRHADDGPKCPACRSPWVDATTGKPAAMASPGSKKRKNREGYENFGAEAGLPSERDTSTYHSWSPYSYSRRRRRW